jgi:hypothetical protein
LPNIVWSTFDTLSLEGQHLSVNSFRHAFADSVRELDTFVHKELLLGLSLSDLGFHVDENTVIHDNTANDAEGYSMFSDPKNPFKDMEMSLSDAFLGYPHAAFLTNGVENGNVIYSAEGVARYLDAYHKANRMLALILHGVGGQPGRGTEFCGIKFDNPRFRARSLYMIGPGQMVYVLFYNKSTGKTGMDRVVAHALPWRVARLVLIMRALVNPFAGTLIERTGGRVARAVQAHSVLSISGKQMTSDQLSAELLDWFKTKLGVQVRLRLFRQFVIAVQRKRMPKAFETIKRAMNVVDAQAGHTTETAETHYAIDADEVNMFAEDTIIKYIAASAMWWKVLFDGMDDMLTARELGLSLTAETTVVEGTRNHGNTVLTLKEDDIKAIAENVNQGGKLSREIADHLVGSIGLVGIDALKELLTRATEVVAPAASTIAAVLDVEPKHIAMLCKYLKKPSAVWSSDAQAQAMIHMMKRETSLLIVLPTGGGKSALFGSMQYADDGVTVVIFPLRALMLDQIGTANKRDPLNVWKVWSPSLQIAQGTVVAQVESLKGTGFLHWCVRLSSQNHLARVVLDEAHLIPTSLRFRDVMQQLDPIVQTGVPIVCLSATVPPTLEPALKRLIGGPTWRVIRTGTQKRNIHYRVGCYASKAAALESLKKHVRYYEGQLEPVEGILIIVRSKGDADEVGSKRKLNCPVYHSDIPDDERDKLSQDWIAGRFTTIVATPGLGTGVHHQGCRIVIHFNLPYGMIGFAQDTGRAGRANLFGLSIILYWKPFPTLTEEDHSGCQALTDMLESVRCMRSYMSRFLDGEALSVTCSNGLALCGRCVEPMRRAMSRAIPAGTDWPDTGADTPLRSGALVPHIIPLRDSAAPVAPPAPHPPVPLLPLPSTPSTPSVSSIRAGKQPEQEPPPEVAGSIGSFTDSSGSSRHTPKYQGASDFFSGLVSQAGSPMSGVQPQMSLQEARDIRQAQRESMGFLPSSSSRGETSAAGRDNTAVFSYGESSQS